MSVGDVCEECAGYSRKLASAEDDELRAQASVLSATTGQQEQEAARVYISCQAKVRALKEEWGFHGLHKYQRNTIK